MRNYTLGTIVYVDILFIRHYGIISDINKMGALKIISNSKKFGRVIEESLDDFSGSRKISECGFPSKYTSHYIVTRAKSLIGKQYNLFSNNCEHFVRCVHHLKPESPQIQIFAIMASITLYGILASRS